MSRFFDYIAAQASFSDNGVQPRPQSRFEPYAIPVENLAWRYPLAAETRYSESESEARPHRTKVRFDAPSAPQERVDNASSQKRLAVSSFNQPTLHSGYSSDVQTFHEQADLNPESYALDARLEEPSVTAEHSIESTSSSRILKGEMDFEPSPHRVQSQLRDVRSLLRNEASESGVTVQDFETHDRSRIDQYPVSSRSDTEFAPDSEPGDERKDRSWFINYRQEYKHLAALNPSPVVETRNRVGENTGKGAVRGTLRPEIVVNTVIGSNMRAGGLAPNPERKAHRTTRNHQTDTKKPPEVEILGVDNHTEGLFTDPLRGTHMTDQRRLSALAKDLHRFLRFSVAERAKNSETGKAQNSEQVVQVHIGRIDIKAMPTDRVEATERKRDKSQVMSLDDYLQLRARGERS